MPKVAIDKKLIEMPRLEPHYYLGIDPGQSGGLAIVTCAGTFFKCTFLEKMPGSEASIWDMISSYCDMANNAMIEKVHAMPQQGVSSTFKFGCGYGGLRMALVAEGIPFEEVIPQTWQKALGVPPRNTKQENKRDHKKKLLAKAANLFPRVKINLYTADALLIAEYCRRKYEGLL